MVKKAIAILVCVISMGMPCVMHVCAVQNDFYLREFDKPYVTFLFDDGRMPYTSEFFEVFSDYDYPMTCAIIARDTDPASACSKSLVDVLHKIEDAGGDSSYLGHTSPQDGQDAWAEVGSVEGNVSEDSAAENIKDASRDSDLTAAGDGQNDEDKSALQDEEIIVTYEVDTADPESKSPVGIALAIIGSLLIVSAGVIAAVLLKSRRKPAEENAADNAVDRNSDKFEK